MGLMLVLAMATTMADSERLANAISTDEPKAGKGTKPNPEKKSKAEKKRESKNHQRLRRCNHDPQ
jgi:hypothetical protein